MRIEWDEPKRRANLQKHGLDFADITAQFDFATAVLLETRPSRTGRGRFKLIGWFRSRLIVVVVASPLGTEAFSVISLRPANLKERVHVEQL
ncbi:hypothetical protein SAMN04487843_11149 [Methylobacterium sp. ap11]|uniref:BrnT family toxin n=1 Tax=Methylobacterium sp. ap11 TaxID=1761799 RepID=UPI0008D26FE8|nr:BrnT family toxin [Methylobacterium sp. ap11]SEP32127.1 hypothetical protein SAMN04487843_11149 [Methylobacterium sp. ap11]